MAKAVPLEKLKLIWGTEMEVHELPSPLKFQDLQDLLARNYGHDFAVVSQQVPVVWRFGIRAMSAKHLPKADRAGLCDSYCTLSISEDSYLYKGYAAVESRSKTKVCKRSLSPEWNDTVLLLIDGTASVPERFQREGRPIVRVSVLDDNSDDGKPDNLIGVVEFDMFDEVAEFCRYERLVEIEKRLDAEMIAAVASQSKNLDQVREVLMQVKAKRRSQKERVEAWHELEWVKGCDPAYKAEVDGKLRVRGADAVLSSIKLGIVPLLSPYHKSCIVNYNDDLVKLIMDASRAELGDLADRYASMLDRRHIREQYIVDVEGKVTLTGKQLEIAGIADPAHRKSILDVVADAECVAAIRNPADLHIHTEAGAALPGLPMSRNSFVSIKSTEELHRAKKDSKEFVGPGPARLTIGLRVSVTLYQARNLPKTDKVGSCDPYVRLVMGNRTGFSKIFFNTMNPDWNGYEFALEQPNPYDTLRISVWDFDELKVLDSKTRKVSVKRQDEVVGYLKVPLLEEIIANGGEVSRTWYDLLDENEEAVYGWSHTKQKQGEQEEKPVSTIELAISVIPPHKRRAKKDKDVLRMTQTAATDRPETSASEVTPEGLLFDLFSLYARGGRAAAKKDGNSMDLESAAITEGGRAYLMDLIEFNLLLKSHGLQPDFFSKADSTEIFYAARGGGKKALQGDRSLDLDEFIGAVKMMGDKLGKTLLQMAHGPENEIWEKDDDESEETSAWRREFPMHAAAADGNTGKFERVFAKLKVMEERANSQAKGEHRDIPYLVSKLLKKRRRTEFRISVKSRNPGAKAPPWAQSSTNMGLVNAMDAGGWTCLHHAVSRGHTELVLRMCVLGFEVNRQNKFYLRTPLYLAVEIGDKEMVLLLLQCGADWNVPDAEGVTPISICSTKLLTSLSKTYLTLDRSDCTLLPGVTEENEKHVIVETITLDQMRAVAPSRPGKCRTILLGSPPQRDLFFPWHKLESRNADSVFEIVTREFDSNSGARPDPDIKDESTNMGRDMPLTVSDHNHMRNVMQGLQHVYCGPKNTVLTRKEMMDSLRAALRVREETDVFYIVYSGSSQKYSGRWLCIDGFVDLNDLMKIWTVSLARAPENGGFPAKGTRLVLIIDSPASGMWVKQFEAIRRGQATAPVHGPFPYCFSNLNVSPSDPTGARAMRTGGTKKRAAPRGGVGRVVKNAKEGDSADTSINDEDDVVPHEWVEAAKDMAIMASCREFERAMENAQGGSFMSKWATHPIQRKMRLEGIELCSAPLQVSGTACRQHPISCVGWCVIPENMDPRIVHIAQGVYLTGSNFFHEDGVGGAKMPAPKKASSPKKLISAYGASK